MLAYSALMQSTTEYRPIDVIKFMVHGALHEQPRNEWTSDEAKIEKQRAEQRQVGFVHCSYSKEYLQSGISFPVSSFAKLERQEGFISHWTPQVYYFAGRNNKGRSLENIRFITCVGVEADEQLTIEQIEAHAEEKGLPAPSVILKTPRGLQWFYVFSNPFVGTPKSVKLAKFIANEIKYAFQGISDLGANPLGYFRIPQKDNILAFSPSKIDTNWIKAWAKKHAKQLNRENRGSKKDSVLVGRIGIMNDPAIKKIISNRQVVGRKGQFGRNNTIYTLALALKHDGVEHEDAYDQLNEWNSSLDYPTDPNEFDKIINSAYQGKFNAPSKDYIEILSGVKMTYGLNIITPPKPREERERSHYHEWEEDLIQYIEEKIANKSLPYLSVSLRSLADELNMAYSTLKEVLAKTKSIVKKVYGRGRAAQTFLTTIHALKEANKKLSKARFKAFLRSFGLTFDPAAGSDNLESSSQIVHLSLKDFRHLNSDYGGG